MVGSYNRMLLYMGGKSLSIKSYVSEKQGLYSWRWMFGKWDLYKKEKDIWFDLSGVE